MAPAISEHLENGLCHDSSTPANGAAHHEAPSMPKSPGLNNQFAFTPRKLRVITIGAGFSGLLMAHKFQHRFPEMQSYVEHTIFEGRKELGGTWAFPFDPNPDWSRFYSSGTEIQDYILRTAKKWDLDRDVRLNHWVREARWVDERGQWRVTVEHQGQRRDEYADVLLSGQGVLVHYKWPTILGLHDFKGRITHSAAWDHDYDYNDKRIAVIGNGSSGIQIVPQLQKLPGTDVTNFLRGPTWVYYRVPPSTHLGRETDDPNPAYTEEEKKRWRENPAELRKMRHDMIARTNKAFRMFVKGSDTNKDAVAFATKQMAAKLSNDTRLCEMLIPKWEVGCRRITPGPGYLESFTKPNCHVTNSKITHISEGAVHTEDGQTHKVDVVVCATGFDVSHRPQYPLIGLNDVDLRDSWDHEPESYLSVAAPDMPNYFCMMGPNAVVGHGSLMEALNWTGDYFCQWIKKIATEDIKSATPKKSAVRAFNDYCDEIHKTLVWSGDCVSWYKRGTKDGRVTALFGGSALLYKRMIENVRAEDFDITYRSENHFSFMGNGFTADEFDDSKDLGWYVEK
ncbi:hypothetical protein LTR91_011249 [Friedmanniomyces endolithicus]|uniref:FAD/NAD(P)-binding domain-containing protein n=1 Tax=Friedmanniomyces endolithicus TaxID=329885 RepID=A0AAN6QRX2_9PEZI|nr:hypothetical protein LTS00_005641 [Friedmanniomyces endolithicus]KAK0305570.1 hypothetical protein LTR01_006717 [Friedmanniomyces endolithicus]KAK0983306.1 hypothetical protein LTR91_011249 [Friedmanniomyces endolithicus]